MHVHVINLDRSPDRLAEFRSVNRHLAGLSRAVAFSLHTYSDPLSVLEADPQAARSMLGLLDGYADSRWHYSEMDIVREPLLDYLRRMAAAA